MGEETFLLQASDNRRKEEEEIMGWFWQKGPLFVKELLEYYEEPKPHFNTLSTIIEILSDHIFQRTVAILLFC